MVKKLTEQKSEKKSETLEVRLPHSKKEAFKAACEDEGITASHAVRTFIDAYLKRSRRAKLKHIAQDITMKLFRNPIKTSGILGTGLIAAFMFGASPSMAEDDAFTYLDKNGDGVITADDSELTASLFADTPEDAQENMTATGLKAADTNGDGRITREEFASVNAFIAKLDKESSIATQGQEVDTVFMIAGENVPLELEEHRAAIQEALKNGNVKFVDENGEITEGASHSFSFVLKDASPTSEPE